MKKYLGILSFLLVLPLTVISIESAHGQGLTAAQKKAQDLYGDKAKGLAPVQATVLLHFKEVLNQKSKIEDTYWRSNLALNQTLALPAIHYAFNQTQQTLLRTNIDLSVGQFMDNNPLIQMIRPMLIQKVREDVQDGIRTGRIRMTQLRPVSKNPVELEVLDIAREVLRESGRTEKEVQSAKIYLAEGNVNAYTFSAQDGEIVVVLQSALLDKLSYQKPELVDGQLVNITHVKRELLKAVFAHENGHIKSGHILQGVENIAMMIQVFKYFADISNSGPGVPDDSAKNEVWGKMLAKVTPSLFATTDKSKTVGGRATLTEAVAFLSAQLDQVFKNNPDEVKSLLNPYLDMLISLVLQNGEMNGGILEKLVMLRSATSVPGSQSPNVLLNLFGEMTALMSREMETSADMYTFNSVARLYAAAVFTSFQGTPLTTPPELEERYVAEMMSAVANLMNEGKEFYDNSTDPQVAETLSSADVDHPQGPLRVENILRYSRTLDAMAMQNPVLKLVVTNSGLLDAVRIAERNQVVLKAQIDKIRPLIAKTKNPELIAKLQEYEKILEKEQLADSELKMGATIISKVTEKQVSTLGYNVNLKDNPLLADVIDFQLARKIRNLWVRDRLTQALAQAKTPEEKEFLQDKIDFFQARFTDGDALLGRIRTKTSKLAKGKFKDINLGLLEKALDPKLTIEVAREYRGEVAVLADFKNSDTLRRARPAIGEENIDISRQSSNRDQHQSAEKIAATDAKNMAVVVKGNYSETDVQETTTRISQGALASFRIRQCGIQLAETLKKPLN